VCPKWKGQVKHIPALKTFNSSQADIFGDRPKTGARAAAKARNHSLRPNVGFSRVEAHNTSAALRRCETQFFLTF